MNAPSYIAPLSLQLNSLNFPFIATTLMLNNNSNDNDNNNDDDNNNNNK